MTCFNNQPTRASITTRLRQSVPVLFRKMMSGKILIESNGVQVEAPESVLVTGETLFVETTAGTQEIDILPDDAKEEANMDSVGVISLEEKDQRPVYVVNGVQPARLFYFIPVTLPITTTIDASSGNTIATKHPWWRVFTKSE